MGINEFSKVQLIGTAAVPGLYKVKVTGHAGSFAVPPANLPAHVTVVLDTPTADTGQCREWLFPGPVPAPSCSANANGSAIKCR